MITSGVKNQTHFLCRLVPRSHKHTWYKKFTIYSVYNLNYYTITKITHQPDKRWHCTQSTPNHVLEQSRASASSSAGTAQFVTSMNLQRHSCWWHQVENKHLCQSWKIKQTNGEKNLEEKLFSKIEKQVQTIDWQNEWTKKHKLVTRYWGKV